jgi:TetR/AcrR family transcriptional regulator, tetracycline repressor protein
VVQKRGATAAKERLSREAIVASAVALADAEGLEAVTIRRLAADHGVTPMALYWHFKDKDLLLDGVAERVLDEVEVPVYAEGEWPEWHVRLRDACAAILEALDRHPEVADLAHERFLGCRSGLDIAEFAFVALRDGGFDDDQRGQIGMQVLHQLVVLVTRAPGERTRKASEEEIAHRIRQKRAFLETLEPERYPNLIDCAPVLVPPTGTDTAYQDLGLNILIEGIRATAPVAAV